MQRIVIFTCFLLNQFLCFGQSDLGFHLQKGDSLRELKSYPASYPYYDSAATIALQRANIVAYARALIGKGYALRFDRENPNYEGAYQLFFQALSLTKDDVDVSVKIKQELYYGLAVTERMRGNYDVAMEYGDLALILAEQLDDLLLVSKCHNMIGNIQAYQGDIETAIESSRRAIKIRESLVTEVDLDLPHWYYNLGIMQGWIEELTESNLYFKKALFMFEDRGTVESSTINVLRQEIAKNFVGLDEIDSARVYYNMALNGQEAQFGKGYLISQHFLFLGDMHKKFAEKDSALFFYQQALIASVTNFDPQSILDNPRISDSTIEGWLLNRDLYVVLDEKAQVLFDLYKENDSLDYLQSAYSCYELAIEVMLRLRLEMVDDDPSLHLAEHAKPLFENALDVVYALHTVYPENSEFLTSAFRYVEQIKHTILLKNKVGDLQIGDELVLVNQLKLIQKEIDELRRKIDEAREEEKFYAKIEELIDNVVSLRTEKEEVAGGIGGKRETVADEFRSVPDVANYLSQSQMLINYFWGERHLYGVAITKTERVLQRIDLKGLQSNLEAFLSASSTLNFEKSEEDFETFNRSAFFLHETLLSPFLNKSSGNDTQEVDEIIIVPDGKINRIPFGALLQKETLLGKVDYKNLNYLTFDYTVTYAFSSSILMLDREQKPKPMDIVGFSSGRLKGAEEELENVKLMWSDQARVFKANESTESNFKSQAPLYDVIHIASHASAGGTSIQPSISFFRDNISSEDGKLYGYEIYPLNLSNQLTILSACETGLGEDFRGEGVFSLARGFAFAGSRSVVTSLWKVRDKQTTELMTRFHENLSAGLSIKNALRQAQLDYISTGNEISSHPSFWSSFILVGNGDNKLQTKRSSLFAVLWLIPFLLIVAFFWRKSTKAD
ncbi:MAG: CHAT domain-containing tetratricopeptide repeat protein [Cyclobacteriaceae bacterium]